MSVPTNVVDRIALIDAILDRLSDQLPVTTPATKGYVSEPVNVPLLGDGKHVQRYWVLHPWVGNPDIEHDLADVNVQLAWGFQLTVAAAYARDVYDLVNHADGPRCTGGPRGRGLRVRAPAPAAGFDPGPARPDTNFTPNRFWLPLQYQTTITRAS
jgi:hypothetical protein